MARLRQIARILLAAALVWLLSERPVRAAEIGPPAQPANVSGPAKLTVTVGKSLIIDSPLNIQRVSVANGELVEAVAVNPKEVLLNGKGPGETSLIVWQQDGNRLVYDLTVRMSPLKLEAVREQIAREFPDDDINVTFDNDTAFVRGTVKDVIAAERVVAIVGHAGQDREPAARRGAAGGDADPAEGAVRQRGSRRQHRPGREPRQHRIEPGHLHHHRAVQRAEGQPDWHFQPLRCAEHLPVPQGPQPGGRHPGPGKQTLLEMLAEPNVLAINGKPASFLSGGEFPFPMVQGGASVGAVTIAFREYGMRLNFLPVITPRGTIRLQVAPEVSSLDYANAVTFRASPFRH